MARSQAFVTWRTSLYDHEVSRFEQARILDAIDKDERWIERQYKRYRRLGLSQQAAVEALRAWGRNTREQAKRRAAHDTGCLK